MRWGSVGGSASPGQNYLIFAAEPLSTSLYNSIARSCENFLREITIKG